MAKKRTRATDEEARAERARAMIEAALALYEEADDYHAVTMASVARRAGVAKGTLYLYFDTKEELFLAGLGERTGQWLEALDEALGALEAPAGAQTVAACVASTLEPRLTLVRLLARLHGTIEPNIAPKSATAFRRRLRDEMLPIGERLEELVEELDTGQGLRFLLSAQALIIGVHQQADPAPPAERALRALDLAMFRVDFAQGLATTLAALLRGWDSEG